MPLYNANFWYSFSMTHYVTPKVDYYRSDILSVIFYIKNDIIH